MESRDLNRRRFLFAGAVAAVGGATLVWNGLASAESATGVEEFDEVYAGRRIRGKAVPKGTELPNGHLNENLFIDDDPVHVMINGDGTYSTSVNHYESFNTLRDAARRGVDTLGDLRPETLVKPGHH